MTITSKVPFRMIEGWMSFWPLRLADVVGRDERGREADEESRFCLILSFDSVMVGLILLPLLPLLPLLVLLLGTWYRVLWKRLPPFDLGNGGIWLFKTGTEGIGESFLIEDDEADEDLWEEPALLGLTGRMGGSVHSFCDIFETE